MNCFNIRELQGILKRKFFNDLINTTDHKDLLNQTLIGMRYKNNQNLTILPHITTFYNYNITILPKIKNVVYNNNYDKNYFFLQKLSNLLLINDKITFNKFNYVQNLNILLTEFVNIHKNKVSSL
jgi:hypothetical protein